MKPKKPTSSVMRTNSTLSTYEQLLSPFGKNHLFIAALPVLAAFVALFMLREFDTFCAFGRRPAKRDEG